MIDDESLQDAVDDVHIRRLQAAYADVVNRRAWSELHDLFLPDAVVHLDTRDIPPFDLEGPAALGEFIGRALERWDFFEFVVLNAHIELRHGGEPDAAAGRMFMCELRHETAGGFETRAYGLYQDRYRRRDGRWWFEDRMYNSIARTGRALDVFPLPPGVTGSG